MRKQDPLFETGPATSVPLSKQYSVPAYRASAEEKPKYAKSVTQLPCDECSFLQHETGGKFGPRAQAKARRSFPGGPNLRLCRRHEKAWRERDEKDIGE